MYTELKFNKLAGCVNDVECQRNGEARSVGMRVHVALPPPHPGLVWVGRGKYSRRPIEPFRGFMPGMRLLRDGALDASGTQENLLICTPNGRDPRTVASHLAK